MSRHQTRHTSASSKCKLMNEIPMLLTETQEHFFSSAQILKVSVQFEMSTFSFYFVLQSNFNLQQFHFLYIDSLSNVHRKQCRTSAITTFCGYNKPMFVQTMYAVLNIYSQRVFQGHFGHQWHQLVVSTAWQTVSLAIFISKNRKDIACIEILIK